ncbi:Uma2 family endonuclease [Aureimonas glaciei]|uniref:Putative restriction endonuclease domain-containing protein n=1 Tax=Aureimonas glaciei TaxID=1776957 RepID=A0A916Y1N5_9HYPH|nr:Uma2 family endonuclease [Aureimonas glaciei]GGD25575.1 hypothetical protein GCM10011335_30610 [Aureimonas glaciei]
MNVQSRGIDEAQKMSIEGFFRWADGLDARYELVDGVPRLQPWVRRSHSLIAGNIAFALQTQLDRSRYAVHQGDFAISTGPNSIRYADVLVEPRGASLDERTADAAILLVEILSPSTMHVDFGPKAQEYLALPGLDTYLIVDADRRRVWKWSRDAEGDWPDDPLCMEDDNSEVILNAVGARLSFQDIYRDVR